MGKLRIYKAFKPRGEKWYQKVKRYYLTPSKRLYYDSNVLASYGIEAEAKKKGMWGLVKEMRAYRKSLYKQNRRYLGETFKIGKYKRIAGYP